MARFLPLGLDLHGTTCVVVGGGRIGTRKAETLLEAGALVTVIAPRLSASLAELHATGELEWLPEPFRAELLGKPTLVVAATNDPAVNESVARSARERGALLCDASSAERSQIIFGALHRAHELTLAVFTDGQDPGLARRARDHIASQITVAAESGNGIPAAGAAALILIAHGSRDHRWRASIEAVIQAARVPSGGARVALAYMDRAPPTLLDAVGEAVRAGCSQLHVLPLFLAPEGHVERDIRPLVEQARAAYPDVTIAFLLPIGQLPGFRRLLRSVAMETGALDGTGSGPDVAGDWPRPEESPR
jgi:precorrin-2 dehydrogenase/sirohydrochlorin ferrochelatase